MGIHMHKSGVYVEVDNMHVAFMQRAGYVLDDPTELEPKTSQTNPDDDLLPEDAETKDEE